MQINHTWTVQTLYTRNMEGQPADVVTAIEYLLTTSAEGLTSVTTSGTELLDSPSDSFKAYADLSEAETLAWLDAVMGNRKAELERRAAHRLLEQVAQSSVKFVPWVSEPSGG